MLKNSFWKAVLEIIIENLVEHKHLLGSMIGLF